MNNLIEIAQFASLILTLLLIIASFVYMIYLYHEGYLSFRQHEENNGSTENNICENRLSELQKALNEIKSRINDLYAVNKTKNIEQKPEKTFEKKSPVVHTHTPIEDNWTDSNQSNDEGTVIQGNLPLNDSEYASQSQPQPQPQTLAQEQLDKVIEDIKADLALTKDQIGQICDGINVLAPQIKLATEGIGNLEHKEYCCFKNTLRQNDVPDDLKTLKDNLDFCQYIKNDVMKEHIPSRETLKEICSFVDWLESEIIQKEESSDDSIEVMGPKDWKKTFQDLEKRIDQLKQKETDLETKSGQLTTAENEIARLNSDHAQQINSINKEIESFAPEEILSLFGYEFEQCSSLKTEHPKQLMAIYSYLSLLRDFHDFISRFRNFERDLRAAYDGDDLTHIREKIQQHLNPKIESSNYRIEWPPIRSMFDPYSQQPVSDDGQTVSYVKTAIIYKKIDNVWKCTNKGEVETV